MLDELKKFLDSPEGKAEMEADAKRTIAMNRIKKSQLERFREKYSHRFDELLEKIQAKYDTREYATRWMKRGIEPQESLLWFLLEYAEAYGREATEGEFNEHGNMLTSEMYYVHGYFFNLMQGQGAALKISKETK